MKDLDEYFESTTRELAKIKEIIASMQKDSDKVLIILKNLFNDKK